MCIRDSPWIGSSLSAIVKSIFLWSLYIRIRPENYRAPPLTILTAPQNSEKIKIIMFRLAGDSSGSKLKILRVKKPKVTMVLQCYLNIVSYISF